MTTNAVREIPAHLFPVLLVDLALIVLVTAVASVGCVAVGMAGGARATRATVVHREGMGTII
jgi:hypothetical protein